MSKSMKIARHELLQDIEVHISLICKEFNLADDVCEQIGTSIADFIADNYGGQVISFPKNFKWRTDSRTMQIYKKFNGANIRELAKEFGITESGIRKAINRARKNLETKGKA
ncbi:TPA: DNA-binding protein [Pasteurella multocida]|uniref:Mor transcription activator family protein n=1 Tax=Pasteurella multocida TaxID=747 RepID=UPI0009F42AF4|nr:Mor transcription activator family protein [Pasteurella multocida]PNM03097.1 DNA-binding protein [Pasteurella multocida]WND43960.1 Mor transcription activator family protein [Pasteurella multocida]HDR1112432.1 DNA-binding protein [Pasteurella multocida]HDR1119737.1 DNA-binding protein [Pasteurella multocida]HDR1137343.1 DNA-binding protein [Pasteurella multocida]